MGGFCYLPGFWVFFLSQIVSEAVVTLSGHFRRRERTVV